MTNRKQKLKGLLTLVVTPKQAYLATRAAFGPRVYRAGNMLYRDRPNDWFTPIGLFKCSGGPPVEQSHEQASSTEPNNQTQEIEPVTITTSAIATATRIGKALGIVNDKKQLARFRECQARIARREDVSRQQREASAQHAAAIRARDAGEVEFEGLRVDAAIKKFEWRHTSLSNEFASIQNAASAAIGLCPDEGLQRELRRIREAIKRANETVTGALRRIEVDMSSTRQLKKNVESLSAAAGHDPSELAKLQRQLSNEEFNLDDAREELAKLTRQRDELVRQRDELFERMRCVKV